MRAFEGFTEEDKYAIKHKTEHAIINNVHCPYYLSKYNEGVFKDMNYPEPRLSLTRFKHYKDKILTFESEESANQDLQKNKKYTDIDQLEVVLRITIEEAAEENDHLNLLLALAKEEAASPEPQKEQKDKTSPTSYENDDESLDWDAEDDFESQIMRDLENGDGDLHGL